MTGSAGAGLSGTAATGSGAAGSAWGGVLVAGGGWLRGQCRLHHQHEVGPGTSPVAIVGGDRDQEAAAVLRRRSGRDRAADRAGGRIEAQARGQTGGAEAQRRAFPVGKAGTGRHAERIAFAGLAVGQRLGQHRGLVDGLDHDLDRAGHRQAARVGGQIVEAVAAAEAGRGRVGEASVRLEGDAAPGRTADRLRIEADCVAVRIDDADLAADRLALGSFAAVVATVAHTS